MKTQKSTAEPGVAKLGKNENKVLMRTVSNRQNNNSGKHQHNRLSCIEPSSAVRWNTAGPMKPYLSSASFNNKSTRTDFKKNELNQSLSNSRTSLVSVSNQSDSSTNRLRSNLNNPTYSSNQHLNTTTGNARNSNAKAKLTHTKSNISIQSGAAVQKIKSDGLSETNCTSGVKSKRTLNSNNFRNNRQGGSSNAAGAVVERSQESPINEMVVMALRRPVLKIKRGPRGFGFTLRAIKVE